MEINVYRCYLRINSSVGTQAGGCGEDPSTLKFQNLIPASTEKEYSYSSTTTIGNVSNSTLSGTNTYKISPSNSSATVSFKHTVVSNTTGGDAYYSKIHGMKYTIEVDGSEKKSTDGTQTSSQPTFNDSITVTVNPGETKQVCAYFNFEPTKLTVTTSGKTTTFSEDGKGGSNACVTIHRPAVADLSITAKISGGGKTASATADKNNPSSSETASGKIVLDGVLAVESKHTATHSGSDNAFSSKNISWAYSLNDIANYNNINKTKNLPSEQSSTIDPTSNPKPKSYSSDQIPLGTESYTISANTSVGGSTVVDGTLDGSELKATAQIEVENPWNFDLKPTVSSDTTSSSYAGSGATARFMVNSERKDESIRATIPPDGTILQYAQIILDGNIESQNAENLDLEGGDTINDISTFNICQFFKNRLSTAVKSECGEESRESRKYYADEENGWNINETFSDTFLNSAEVGDKICYAVAVNYVDSGYDNEYGIDYKYVVPATANQRTLSRWRNHWRISNLSCGTTSKRPHFEVWGGSVYSAGKVAGATMRYYENGSYKIFGSWVDFGIVAKKAISKVASGASLAQGSTPINNSSPEPSFCDYSPLTITNHECIESNTKLGNSSINMESITLNRLRQKFTPQPNNISSTPTANLNADSGYTGYETKKFTNQATNGKYRYTYSANDLTINPDGPSILPQGITHIIYAKGNITINRNLTYSDTPYAKASDIPQYIIISDKNISISENVTRIDAWLVADKGIIDTCNKAEVGDKNNGVSLGVCSESLEVNGPVFAKKIKLDRTAGADPSSLDTVDDYAEKFDVGAATYLWAYNQALNYDQAKTVHLRELAPRY